MLGLYWALDYIRLAGMQVLPFVPSYEFFRAIRFRLLMLILLNLRNFLQLMFFH